MEERVEQCQTSGGRDGGQPSAKRQCRDGQTRLAPPRELRQGILQHLLEPVVLRGYLGGGAGTGDGKGDGGAGWGCLEWSIDKWGEIFGNQELDFRVGQRVGTGQSLSAPQWESECQKAVMTFCDFLEWARGATSCTTTSGTEVKSATHWAYFDYYYLKDLGGQCQLEGAMDWGALGFPERGVGAGTLWIGSAGANTPCHIDTYGCNLIVQVLGRKRWVLFPECQSGLLSATRVPYEESSIYSSAGFPRPSLQCHPKLASATPYVITLHPGDTLFVPRHWWHSVENLDLAVSLNTWLEVPEDSAERVKEALVMYSVASLCQGVTSLDLLKSVFNPNMLDLATMTSPDLLALLREKVLAMTSPLTPTDTPVTSSLTPVTPKVTPMHTTNTHTVTPSFTPTLVTPTSKINLPSTLVTSTPPHPPSLTPSHPPDPQKSAKSRWHCADWLAKHSIEKVPHMTFCQYQRDILALGQVRSGQGVPGSATSQLESDLRVLIDAFTDRRVVSVLKEVLEEKMAERREMEGCGREAEEKGTGKNE
ncbi:HSPB1-associated protein 1 [Portunus trituberculatus]|uniref:HSPB1-associated protein 1 n=1 Tax=Portunus trituberculatus TaxID=210409 RepID=A0A5B7G1F7_PORTR|nr:HSPB1-associated protein 1 [Portunus trituberculatus]